MIGALKSASLGKADSSHFVYDPVRNLSSSSHFSTISCVVDVMEHRMWSVIGTGYPLDGSETSLSRRQGKNAHR
jgi:hypothetical protein